MAHVDDHTPLTPGWIDLGTDVLGAKAFYSSLFGWDTADAGPVEQTGGYGFFLKEGRQVGGYGPQQNPGPPSWTTYVIVPDADAIAAEVTAAGGSVVVPTMAVMDQGSLAVFSDPTGAIFSVWQPDRHHGAQVVREPGAFSWVELSTRDTAAAKAFYEAVFGWSARDSDAGGMAYTEFQVDGESIAGMMEMAPDVPDEVPSYWMVYFEVEDVDGAVTQATSLGASTVAPAMDFPGGRFAILTDPQGAMFGVLRTAALA